MEGDGHQSKISPCGICGRRLIVKSVDCFPCVAFFDNLLYYSFFYTFWQLIHDQYGSGSLINLV